MLDEILRGIMVERMRYQRYYFPRDLKGEGQRWKGHRLQESMGVCVRVCVGGCVCVVCMMCVCGVCM